MYTGTLKSVLLFPLIWYSNSEGYICVVAWKFSEVSRAMASVFNKGYETSLGQSDNATDNITYASPFSYFVLLPNLSPL